MQNISVCIIGKNESHVLEKCLQALAPYPWEIVFTDTGSTDETKAIARKYTSNVYDFEWIDDFSAARNFCAKKASNDWILTLDCDEILDSFDFNALISSLPQHTEHIGELHLRNLYTNIDGTEEHFYHMDVLRLYHRKYYHFIYSIHEQLVPLNSSHAPATFTTILQGLHVGYALSPEQANAKQRRNIDQLEKELAEGNLTEDDRPYFLFQLGYSYTNTDLKKALSLFLQAFEYDINPTRLYYHLLVIRTGETYQKLGLITEGHKFLRRHSNTMSDHADFHYTLGFFEYNTGNIEEAINCYQRALIAPTCNNQLAQGDGSHYNLGLLYLHINDIANASLHLEQCINFRDAKEKLGLAYYQYGKQLFDAGMSQEAMPFIQRASLLLEENRKV